MAMQTQGTHERFIHATRDAVIDRALALGQITDDQAAHLGHAKLVYGIGNGSYRGVCHYEAWENGIGKVDVVEIAATAEESWVQLAGTTIHELGHVLAGYGTGHGKGWKAAAERLGLRTPKAAGQVYVLAQIAPSLRQQVASTAEDLSDGTPAFRSRLGTPLVVVPRPCSAGIGTRGGTSRGKGSGSRLRLWECQGCEKPIKVRIASDDFQATCDRCETKFVRIVV